MTGKSIIIGNKSELHPSITPFFVGCFFISLLFHFQNGNVFGKLKEATMPVCQCPTTSGSANLRRKFVSMIRILNKSKKPFFSGQLCEFIFLGSCPDIYENLWNQLGAPVVSCNDSGGQNIMLFRPITNTKSQRYIKETNTVEKAWTVL